MRHLTHLTATVAALAGSIAAAPAVAIELIELDDIIVSAGQEPRAAGRTGATVTTATAEQVQATGELSLTEYLARMPGVGILSRGGLGGQTSFTLRGVSQNYVKVLVDGIDVSDPSAPQVAFNMGRLTGLGFGRLELLRGSQSAVHGGQAVAGVLSFESPVREALGSEQTATFEVGSYGTVSLGYEYAQRTETGSVSIAVSQVHTDGYSAKTTDTEADGYDATRLSVKGETTLENGVTLGFSAFAEVSDGDYDPYFPGDVESDDETSHQTTAGVRAYARFDVGTVEHEVSASHFSMERSLYGSETYSGYLSESELDYSGRRSTLAWKAATDIGAAGRLVFGADATRETYSQTSDYGYGAETNGASSDVVGVFAEYAHQIGNNIDVVASVRHDDHSVFGGQDTARLAASWRIDDAWTLRSSLGTGFRAPSGYELYGPYGSTDLEPEQSQSFDLGLERALGGNAYVRATLFRIDTDNLIDFSDMGTTSDYSDDGYVQVEGLTRRQGLELEAAIPLGERFELTAAYTYTDATTPDLSYGNTWSSGFGRHQVALTLGTKLNDALRLDVAARLVAERPTLPDYTVVTAALHYELAAGTEAYLRIENLFDEDYQTVSGYNTSGRAFYLGLRKTF